MRIFAPATLIHWSISDLATCNFVIRRANLKGTARSLCIASVAFASLYANAQVHSFDVDGKPKIASANSINYIGARNGLELNIISGLDMHVSVVYTSESASHDVDLGVVAIRDEITVNGDRFYGKKFPLNTLSDGVWDVSVIQRDNNGKIKSETSQTFVVDSVIPSLGTVFWNSAGYKLDNIPNGQYLGDFEVWNWGAGGVNDALSGIEKVVAYATDIGSSEAITSPIELSYNPSTQKATFPAAPNAIMPVHERSYRMHVEVHDKAGNVARTSRDITWTGIGKEPELVGVNDGTYSGTFLPGSPYWGFKPYQPGMAVNSYNFELVYRLPYQWVDPNNPGRMFSTRNQFNVLEYVRDGYAYFKLSNIYSKDSPRSHEKPLGRHDRWVSYFLYYDLNLAPHLAPPPVGTQDAFMPHIGWVGRSYGEIILGRHNIASKPTHLRVTADPRPYHQRVMIQQHGPGGGPSNCVILAGQRQCQTTLPTTYNDWKYASPNLPADTILIRHFWMNHLANDGYRELKSQTLHGLNIIVDKSLPIIKEAKKEPFSNLFKMEVIKEHAGEVWGRIGLSQIGLKFTNADNTHTTWHSDGFNLNINGKNTPVSGGLIKHEFAIPDPDSVPDGNYNVSLIANDTANNVVEVNLGALHVERDAPVLDINGRDGQVLEGNTVSKLQDIEIIVNDVNAVANPTATLIGGIANDTFELKVNASGDGRYGIETPKVFPTLEENLWYEIQVSTVDELGNVGTKTSRFKYVPENIISFGSVVTLTANEALLQPNDDPITKVTFEPMTVEGGQVASGVQDYFVTVSTRSNLTVEIDGVKVRPGQSKLFQVDLGEGGKPVMIPIKTHSGEVGSSDLMIEIPQLKSKYN